jgi:hypothetical protein
MADFRTLAAQYIAAHPVLFEGFDNTGAALSNEELTMAIRVAEAGSGYTCALAHLSYLIIRTYSGPYRTTWHHHSAYTPSSSILPQSKTSRPLNASLIGLEPRTQKPSVRSLSTL